jgi:hypothetical protein
VRDGGLLRRRLQLPSKPCVRSERPHRIVLFDNILMDALARRAFERPNFEAHAARGDAGQLSLCLVGRTKWFVDHNASPWIGRERYRTLSHRELPSEGDGDGPSLIPSRPSLWSMLLTCQEKFMRR